MTEISRFKDIDDLLTGVDYILSVETVQHESPQDYALLQNYYTRYKGYHEAAVLPHLVNLVEALITRHNLIANPAVEPVRAMLQANGWMNVLDCIRGCEVVLRVSTSATNVNTAAALLAQVNLAKMDRLSGTLVSLDTVGRMCDLYTQMLNSAMTEEVLDTEFYFDVN